MVVAALVEKVLKLWQTDKYGAALYGVPMLIVLFAMARAAQDRVPYWRNAQTLYHHEVYVCPPTRASEEKADCAYFAKPNSFMILGLLARESGDETLATVYFDEAKDANDWKQGLLKEALADPILWWTGGLASYRGLAGFQREMARREMERAKSWPPSP